MKNKGIQRRRFRRSALLGIVVVCAAAAALASPGAPRAHGGCTQAPEVPPVRGTYPNQEAYAWGHVYCTLIGYSGDVRLRGWTGSSWIILEQTFYGPVSGNWTPATPFHACYTYNFVDTFMYANFQGHGHTNNSSSAACNFP